MRLTATFRQWFCAQKSQSDYSLPWHITLGTAKEQVTDLGKSSFAFWSHHIHVPSPGPTVVAWEETLWKVPMAVQGVGMQGKGICLGLQLNNFIFYQISKAEAVFCLFLPLILFLKTHAPNDAEEAHLTLGCFETPATQQQSGSCVSELGSSFPGCGAQPEKNGGARVSAGGQQERTSPARRSSGHQLASYREYLAGERASVLLRVKVSTSPDLTTSATLPGNSPPARQEHESCW